MLAASLRIAALDGRIAQAPDLLRERQFGDRLVARMGLERIARQLEPEQQADRPRRDLRRDRSPRARCLRELVQRLAPALGTAVALRHRERDRTFRVVGDPQHHRQIFVDRRLSSTNCSTPAPCPRIAPAMAVSSSSPAFRVGVKSPVEVRWLMRARRGEAERAGPHRVGGKRGHRAVVFGRRRLAPRAALAHHIDAQRRMRQLRADVDVVSRASTASSCSRGSSPTPTACRRSAPAPGCPRRPPSVRSGGDDPPDGTAQNRRRNCP